MQLNNKINRTLFFLIILGSVFFIIKYSIVKIRSKDIIWFEAENPTNELSGFSIIESNELSGGRGVVSVAGSHIIEDYLEYNFFTNSTTKYFTWGRMYGENACGNSFYVSFDNSNKYLIGNDDIMKRWHWLKGPDINLNPGKHKMYIWNQEQRTGIDRILLTSNNSFIPTGKGESDDFQIEFSNKHTDIFDYNDSSKWFITKCNFGKSIGLKSFNNEDNYIVLKNRTQVPYYFKGEFYFNSLPKFNLLFIYRYVNSFDYSFIEITNKTIKKYRKNKGIETLLGTTFYPVNEILNNKINRISLLNKGEKRFLLLNGLKIEEIKDEEFYNGNIGLGTKKDNIYFTNILLTTNILPTFNSNFFDGIGSCEVVNGMWKLYRDPLYNISGKKVRDTPGVVLNGFEFWNDYTYKCIVHLNKTNFNGATGLLFNYQDANNYYLFEYENSSTHGKIKLIKVRNGKVSILNEINKKLNEKQFYKFTVSELNDSIKAYVDEKLVFNMKDGGDLFGKIGLFNNSTNYDVLFDDPNVYPTSLEDDSVKVFDYSFNNRLSISNDLSDWIDSYDLLSPVHNSVFITKQLFMPIEIYNKKNFTDEVNLEMNTSSIPLDIDLCINLKSIENKNNILVTLKANSLILKINSKEGLNPIKFSQRGRLNIVYKDLEKKLSIKVKDNELINCILSEKLGKYKLGIAFEGVGNWEVIIPPMRLITNKYFVDKF